MSDVTTTLKFEDSDGTVEIWIYDYAMVMHITKKEKSYMIDIDPTQIKYDMKQYRLTTGVRGFVKPLDIDFKVNSKEKRDELFEFFADLDFQVQGLTQRLSQLAHPVFQKANGEFRLALRIT